MTDPWQPDANILQPNVINGKFCFSYPRRELAADLQYFVDVSTNLLTWDTSGTDVNQSIVSDNGTVQTVLITDTSSLGQYATRFFRVRVEFLPP